MATEGIISDIGVIYKRLFHHRPVIQNEVHLFLREFETKRGHSDLQCLQSCVSMVSEMEAVYLEDITALRTNFIAIHSLSEEVSDLCNNILSKERGELGVSFSEQERLDKNVEEYKLKLEQDYLTQETEFKTECQRLEEEIKMAHSLRMRLRSVSVGSSVGLSLSNHGSNNDSSLEEEEEEEEDNQEQERERDDTSLPTPTTQQDDKMEDGVCEDQNEDEVSSETDEEINEEEER